MNRSKTICLWGVVGEEWRRFGRAVAEDLQLPLEEVPEGAGAAELARRFREGRAAVLMVGAASLLDRSLRLEAVAAGVLVSLDRPTGGEEAHLTLSSGEAPMVEQVARIRELFEAEQVLVPLGDRSYCVDIAPGGAAAALDRGLARLRPSRLVVVSDENVAKLVLPGLEDTLAKAAPNVRIVVPSGERHKTLATVEGILKAAVQAPIDRRAVFVGVGGGVVTDMTGLAAALALRGVRWVGVPTTVLAMVDASVGGKTAVDLGPAKNAVGAFHQPTLVVVDPSWCRTESDRAFRSGLAEVVKTAVLGDRVLFDDLSAGGSAERLVEEREPDLLLQAVRASVAVKAGVVGRDETESGERAHLNLGHTIGHALEAEGDYERLTHGEAVSLGMVAALRVGMRLGLTPPAVAEAVTALLRRLRLPTDLDAEPVESALRWVAFDKKRQDGAVRMILVRDIGRVEVRSLTPTEVAASLRP